MMWALIASGRASGQNNFGAVEKVTSYGGVFEPLNAGVKSFLSTIQTDSVWQWR